MTEDYNNFQVNTLRIISMLLEKDAIDDSILEELWKNELEYFTLLEKYKILNQKINIDEKTGLLKYNDNYLTDIVKTASRIMSNNTYPKLEIGFVRFDIDNFSSFNDRYGHDLGDHVLKKVSSVIRDFSRPTDYVIRFGGEEFDVILPSTNLNGTAVYVNKILDETRRLTISYRNKKIIRTTMSAGITACRFNIDNQTKKSDVSTVYKKIQKKADDALYEAKFLGKNRFSVYEYSKIRMQYVKNK